LDRNHTDESQSRISKNVASRDFELGDAFAASGANIIFIPDFQYSRAGQPDQLAHAGKPQGYRRQNNRLALACDLIVASEQAQFSLPEVLVGVLADAACFRLPKHLPRQIAMEMLFTGRRMGAEEAGRWGLVNAVTTQSGLMDKAREYAQAIVEAAPLAVVAVKEVARATEALDIPACYELIRSGQLKAYERMLASEDAKEGPRAFAEKRQPVWQDR
jgi:1,4-dihydroxy-2-naphthoyl-CoA synthase